METDISNVPICILNYYNYINNSLPYQSELLINPILVDDIFRHSLSVFGSHSQLPYVVLVGSLE